MSAESGQQKIPIGKAAKKPARPSIKTGAKAIEMLPDRYQLFVDGVLRPEDMTLDELRRGRLADKDGAFRGRPPTMVPAQLQSAMVRELQRRMNGRFRELAFDAIDTIQEVMEAGEGEQISQFQRRGTGRFKAAQYVVERIIGKIPDKLEVDSNVTVWQGAQESGELFVDVEVDEIEPYQEAEIVSETPAPARKRGPRTRPQSRGAQGEAEAGE